MTTQTTTTIAEATDGGTNWELVFIGITAVATLLLAAATYRLARSTSNTANSTEKLAEETRRLTALTEGEVEAVRRQVEVSGEQAAIARETVSVSRASHEGNVRPVLVNVPFGRLHPQWGEVARVPGTREVLPAADPASVIVEEVSERLFVSVPLRNAGAGIAFLWNCQFSLGDVGVRWGGQVSTAALPPGEAMRVSVSLPSEWPEWTPPETATRVLPTLAALTNRSLFSVSVHYADLAGNKWSSRLNLSLAEPAHVWEVVNVVLGHEGRTDEVGSGIAWDFLSHSTGSVPAIDVEPTDD